MLAWHGGFARQEFAYAVAVTRLAASWGVAVMHSSAGQLQPSRSSFEATRTRRRTYDYHCSRGFTSQRAHARHGASDRLRITPQSRIDGSRAESN